MDGVLADFDTGYEKAFGVRPCKAADNVDWDLVRRTPNFYRDLPPMWDAHVLWSYIAPHDPAVLTGVPWSIPEAPANKRAWAPINLTPAPSEVICCPSRDKRLYCKPGDILIDDWEKYKQFWNDAGGIFITHTSAADTIARLRVLGIS
jgi:hypothetical protein